MDQQAQPNEPLADELEEHLRSVVGVVKSEAEAIREEARKEAGHTLAGAEAEGRAYVAEAHRQAESIVAARIEAIGEISDELLERAEAVSARLDDAIQVRDSLHTFLAELGETASRAAAGQVPAESDA